MKTDNRARRRALLTSAAAPAIALALWAGSAAAQEPAKTFAIAPQPLADALLQFSKQADIDIVASTDLTRGRTAPKVAGEMTTADAMSALLAGSGLVAAPSGAGYVITRASDPQSGSAAGDGAGTVEALIVTAQKREENIQDVPIAMSAFTQENLERSQVAGGPDLMTQVPNMTFTKTNFSSYSIQIRGIGTQAISATTDPAVAVAFNNTPFIRNRFFEQEFYDLERLEVLRGPQGTLYGRNATAGVVNLISAKPKFAYESKLSADVGNYASTRLEGMVNLPLVEDKVALRIAGAWTKRDGYATNELTGKAIDGRDLWSTRVSLRFEPTDNIHANLIWEHFQENDDRLRSGKQLCKKNVVDHIGNISLSGVQGGTFGQQTYLSQGCEPVSLYSPEAFQTPNGYALPYYGPTANLGNPVFSEKDPYVSGTQSRDLRVIESSVEPDYRAKSDIAELQLAINVTDNLTLTSETAYSTDSLFSLEDYNRFTTGPQAFDGHGGTQRPGVIDSNGVFCDPQLGCSDRLLLVDLSTSNSTQFSQEVRLSSDFDGPLNFSVGANYLRHDAEDKYYVFINSISLFSAVHLTTSNPYIAGVSDNSYCMNLGAPKRIAGPGSVGETAPAVDPTQTYRISGCIYIDPNPISSLNDQGRNYFLSRNPYKLISYAVFGEMYYDITSSLKLTAGLRWTVDKKQAPQIPSWLLVGFAAGPYPVAEVVDQEWREPTGRLTLDWKPTLDFTDQTLLYASYAHGYKAGGANPPPPVFAVYGNIGNSSDLPAREVLPETFDPEFIDAFEVGTKNTLLGGALTLNLTSFYYNYKGYQVSEIRDRSAVNSNYDATVWGAELEADWRVTDALRLGFKGGYEKTRIADGQSAIDLMDRTAGHDDWVVVRPFPTVPSNCILPVDVVTAGNEILVGSFSRPLGGISGPCIAAYYLNLDPVTQLPYNPNDHLTGIKGPLPANYANYQGFDPSTAPNGGRGFSKDLGGNELPNAPNFTATVTADYTFPLRAEWMLNLHADYHYQSKSWWRVFNDLEYDRLKAFSTVNLSAVFTNADAGWKVMAYVKNVLDEDSITGAFLNSDDTGLTTNVFLTEPRLYGLRVTKEFNGGAPWWGDAGHHEPGAPYAFEIEIGGGIDRFDGPNETYAPNWLHLYHPTVALPLSIQDQDLDWGDTRDIRLTYNLPASGWHVSGSYRFGRTNGQAKGAAYEPVPGGYAIVPAPKYSRVYVASPDNHWRGVVHDTEEHGVADFAVGKDVGLGAFGEGGKSIVSVGTRYANLRSKSVVLMDGVPDRYIPPTFNPHSPASHRSHYTTSLRSDRGFEGFGPSVDWAASIRLVGDDQAGHADLDWSVGGAVLFGKQDVTSNEARFGQHYTYPRGVLTATTLYNDVVPRHRSDNVTAPNLSATLGLSYTVDRVKVSTGYSYDRFFDAIDGGYKDAKSYDRTIQGPYFKIAVGFGG